MIRLSDIHKTFGAVYANRGASLDVADGEIHALVGENGAGKSTLMRILSGMFPADSGTIEVNGKDVTGWTTADAIESGVGMVHQHFMLVPTLTVTENVILGAEITRGLNRKSRSSVARRASPCMPIEKSPISQWAKPSASKFSRRSTAALAS